MHMIGAIRKWCKKEDGTTAIEFSLLLLPYLMISLGIIELSLMMASASVLESATGKAARIVKTGQVQQSGGDPAQMFRDAVCEGAVILVSCDSIEIEARVLDSYGDYTQPTLDASGSFVPQGFAVGGSNDKVLLRVGFEYSMITPIVGPLLNGADGTTLFMSTVVLQTEPYEFQGGS